jgi:hypothetical protein
MISFQLPFAENGLKSYASCRYVPGFRQCGVDNRTLIRSQAVIANKKCGAVTLGATSAN